MLDNYDVKNIENCVESMLEIIKMTEIHRKAGLQGELSSRNQGYANFSYFLSIYTVPETYIKKARTDADGHRLRQRQSAYGK